MIKLTKMLGISLATLFGIADYSKEMLVADMN